MAEAPPGARPVDEFDWSTAKPIGSPGVIARARDAAISAGKGVVGVGEAALGLADIATLGRAGKAAEAIGVNPKAAKAFLSEQYTAEQQAANKAIEDAQGVGGTLLAIAQNPSTIAHGLIESAPSMLAGGAISRAIPAAQAATATTAAVRGLSPVIRGAIGEGAVTAGATAEQVRQETPGGVLSPEQAALAAGSGFATGAISAGSGLAAKKLGLADLETMMAGGGAGSSARGRLARGAGGALSEGALEEAPQSFQEQVAQNLALGKPWAEGAPEAAAFGGVLGAVMGGGLGAISRGEKPKITPEDHAIEAALRAEKAVAAGKEVPEIKRLLGPGKTTLQMGEGNEPFDLTQQHATQNAIDHAAAVDQARAEEEARLARFAANGPISAAAATAMSNGAAEAAMSKRMEQPEAESPLTMPVAATEEGKTRDANLATLLSQSPSMTLAQAQTAARMAAERDLKATVVPHPSGGFTIAPTSFLGREARERFGSIQKQGQLPAPGDAMPGRFTAGPQGVAPTTFSQNNPEQRRAFEEMRRVNDVPVPRQMPIDTFEAAKNKADKATLETGVEHEVAPHPLSSTKFAIRPVAAPQVAPQEAPQVTPQAGIGAPEGEGAPTAGGGRLGKFAAGLRRMSEKLAAGPTQEGNEPTQTGAPAAREELEVAPASAPGAQSPVDLKAHEAAASMLNDRPQPTAAQVLAGNYKKARLTSKEDPRLAGLNITIETPAGAPRVAADGSWASVAPSHYGYINRTVGEDGDPIDVHVGKGQNVYLIDQVKENGDFDEHKVMAFFDTAAEAEAAYKAAYPKDWKGFSRIVDLGGVDGLKRWIKDRQAPKADLSAAALAGLVVETEVEIAETGEKVKVQQDAKEALVEARSKVRMLEQLSKCLAS